jgi:ferredoxin-type protein NapG
MTEVDMGLAVVDDRLCVSINGSGVCGACFTVCPLRGQAITQTIRNAPEVHEEYCTGCGLCEQFCIVDERAGIRAIQVTTNRHWNGTKEAA